MWKDTIKINLKGVGRKGVNWHCRTPDTDKWRALSNTVMGYQVPKKVVIS